MPTTGDLTADAWDEEYRRTGQVTFPVRRRPVVVRAVVVGVLAALRAPRAFTSELAVGWAVADWVVLVLLMSLLAYSLWQLATGEPKVVVDARGIHRRGKSVAWSSITAIGFGAGGGGLKVESANPPNKLFIRRDSFRDITMARAWFVYLLENHRRSGAQSW
ncbi:hypothetical protein E1263_41495 [Kribbella antibiotica]|uniref:PH domain-containing protein n=1 Tax=Kribbella antibiotica TaxID=190195 RepID=A0A4R4YFU9_9ACTN|nr:hypothetical protein [Kribbella antibiotica]TDD43678.1 hypothetical protein E1263_41495 [Kribbella antibiotica]